ncbi:SMI1/KNR4 family protein [Fictibacillus halophilus]|uniref:SMI1/KNR4 family protein n=1 Tax=Fictibacillus halophilus TaxID=1610490 RepID=UPI001CFBCCF5|nr:SMI1/KNR4 family protein [Fictibacillus halophilus]
MINLSNLEMDYSNYSVSENEINETEKLMNIKFPKEYVTLLLKSNGFLTTEGIFIYGTEDILERNETWEVKEYANGFVAIGDDSGGRIFLMASQQESTQVLIVDSGELSLAYAEVLSSDLIEWIKHGCEID